jgi:hypothetical protein
MSDMIPRLRSVRFKDGRAPLRVIRPAEAGIYRAGFVDISREIAGRHENMAGYVVIAWSRNGATSTDCATAGYPVPQAMLPDFAKTCVADWLSSNNK